jgi:hypothetical protein
MYIIVNNSLFYSIKIGSYAKAYISWLLNIVTINILL